MILREDKQACDSLLTAPLLSSMTDPGAKGHGDNSAPAAWEGQAQALQRALPLLMLIIIEPNAPFY